MAKSYRNFTIGDLNAFLGLAIENILAMAAVFSGLAIFRRSG